MSHRKSIRVSVDSLEHDPELYEEYHGTALMHLRVRIPLVEAVILRDEIENHNFQPNKLTLTDEPVFTR